MPIRIRKEFFDLSNFIFQYGNRVVGFMLNVDNEPVDLLQSMIVAATSMSIILKYRFFFQVKGLEYSMNAFRSASVHFFDGAAYYFRANRKTRLNRLC